MRCTKVLVFYMFILENRISMIENKENAEICTLLTLVTENIYTGNHVRTLREHCKDNDIRSVNRDNCIQFMEL
jgi:hypothetical protein